MFRLVLLAGLLLNPFGPPTTWAQTGPPLTGRVFDLGTKQPVPGAVVVPDLQQSTATEADDRFTLPALSGGRFLLEVHSLGYRTASQQVRLVGGTVLEIGLSTAATELGQVAVTGVSGATEARRSSLPTAARRRHAPTSKG